MESSIIKVFDYYFDFSDMTYWNVNSTKEKFKSAGCKINYDKSSSCWEYSNGSGSFNRWKDYALGDFDDNFVTKEYNKYLNIDEIDQLLIQMGYEIK